MNHDKRELPCSATRHLGFHIDLVRKAVCVTGKQQNKVVKYFDHFVCAVRRKGRIRIRNIQKMLGLQIWIGTVFRITRQFITSTCDILRVNSGGSFFYPRKQHILTARALCDLKFWRRFITSSPTAGFDYLLNRMPENTISLASDAALSHGMGGVLMFKEECSSQKGFDGLFWQMT